jgi:general secretion pathway protein A
MAGYVEHFGFKLPPFNTAPDPRFAYATREHELALLKMQDSVEQRLGLCLLMGEIGAGKSTIAHLLLKQWASDSDRYAVAYLADPSPQTPAQFLRLLISSFGLTPSRFIEANRDILRGYLIDNYRAGRTVVALLDEAQTISPPNMTTIQHLSNEQTSETKLLQLCLLGQPNFLRKLSYFPALQSRIARRGNLDPLLLEDAIDMMRHRVKVAGGNFDRLFPLDVHRPLYNATGGIPRHICILCDNALFQAFSRGKKSVDLTAVTAAICDTDYEKKEA